MLYHELRHFHIQDIRQAITQMPTWRLWAAAGFTALNYLVLIGYDYLALLLLLGNELAMRRVAVERLWLEAGGWAGTILPTLLAWTTLIAGSILLLSSATPIVHARLGLRPRWTGGGASGTRLEFSGAGGSLRRMAGVLSG